MPYDYKTQRNVIFTDEGQRMFLKIRDKANQLLNASGSFRMDAVMKGLCGDTWDMLACVDRMVELGEIKEITTGYEVAAQHRIFIR